MRKGFTLIELMVVILMVGILAAVSIPLMQGRVDSAKWSEANAMAGTVRSAVLAYFAETGSSAAIVGTLDDATIQGLLGFNDTDLTASRYRGRLLLHQRDTGRCFHLPRTRNAARRKQHRLSP
jgi:prepilin-type N-terminal cleavage/methylation domain-containing protein